MALYSGYQGAARCTTGPTPGARALMAWFLGAYAGQGGKNLGIYNCRSVRGGTTTSLHGEGRAVDLGIVPHGAAYGTALADRLMHNSAELGIQCIIWNRRIWSGSYPTQGFRPYNGVNAHVDHLHVELSWNAANTLTAARVAQVMGNSVSAPPTVPAREENDVLVQAPIYWDANRNFRTTCKAEAGAGSVFSGGWAFVSATWGALTDVRVFAHDGKGRTWGPYSPAGGTVQNNTEFMQPLPAGTRYFTAEGRAANQSSIATVSAICKPA